MVIFTVAQHSLDQQMSEETLLKTALIMAKEQHMKDHLEKHPDIPLEIKPIEEGVSLIGSLHDERAPLKMNNNYLVQGSDQSLVNGSNPTYHSATVGKELLMPMGCACGEMIMARFEKNPNEGVEGKNAGYSSADYAANFSGMFVVYTGSNDSNAYSR